MTLDLGVDAGGSKAAWSARDAATGECSSGVVGAIQAAASDPVAVAGALGAIVDAAERDANRRVGSLVAGIAGAGLVSVRRAVRTACTNLLGAEVHVAIVGDVEVAAASCLAEGPGLAVWAGTGSFCVARAADGSLHRAGGRGLLLDDRGGAAAIVLAAARVALESDDGVRAPTTLTTALAMAFGAARARELGRVMRDLPPSELSLRLEVVTACAAAGDELARLVFADEAARLADRAAAAVDRAELSRADCPIWFGGGALAHCVPLREALIGALCERGMATSPTDGGDAAVGAAVLARALREARAPLCHWLEDDHAA